MSILKPSFLLTLSCVFIATSAVMWIKQNHNMRELPAITKDEAINRAREYLEHSYIRPEWKLTNMTSYCYPSKVAFEPPFYEVYCELQNAKTTTAEELGMRIKPPLQLRDGSIIVNFAVDAKTVLSKP